jgi:acetyl-CoA carboxylase biotin carboxyl carrier protein
MPLTHEDIREILRLIDESDLAELRIETHGFSLHVRKDGAGAPALAPRHDDEPAAASDELITVPSPMLGTFYRAEGPGRKPFVELGSQVEPDTTICIIEVMKMMNSIPAGVRGTVVEVCAENGTLVEYGQPLYRVKP